MSKFPLARQVQGDGGNGNRDCRLCPPSLTAGQPYCPKDGGKVEKRTLDDAIEQIMKAGQGRRMLLLAPYLIAKAAVLREELPSLERRGFQRIRIEEIKRLMIET